MYVVYILRCRNGELYVGHTSDLAWRVRRHNEGLASSFTASRRPVAIAYQEEHRTHLEAIRRERQVKRWTRAKKEALVAGDLAELKRL